MRPPQNGRKSCGGIPPKQMRIIKQRWGGIDTFADQNEMSGEESSDSENDNFMSNNRIPLTARKSTGGKTPSNYQKIADLQRRQSSTENGVQKQTTEEDNINSGNNNNRRSDNNVETTNMVTPSEQMLDDMPLIHFMPSNKNTMTITAAAGLNDPARFKMLPVITSNSTLPVKVVPHAAMEYEKNSTELAINSASTSEEHQCNQDSESDNFTLQLSTVETTSNNAFLTLDKITKASPKKDIRKRPTSSSQSGTAKKSKRNEKNLCKKFVDNLNDKNILLNELSQQFDLEDILKAYKENKTAEDIDEEAVRVLGLESKTDTANPEISNNMSAANMSCLQNILSELYKLYGSENFTKISLKTIRDRLKPSDILEYFSINEVKEALFQKCPPVELVNQLTNSDPSVVSEILKSASVDEIISQVRKRNELSTSEPLLQEMLESFSQVIPEETSPDCDDTVDNPPISKVALCSAFTNAVKSKKYLNSCEDLFNVLLRDGPKILSEESKMNLKNILEKKFSGPEFNDISHEITRYHLSERVIAVD